MSRHVSRKERWEGRGPTTYRSVDRLQVRYEKGAWWAEVAYRVRAEEVPAGEVVRWEPHFDQLGPFKRPRNAMVEAERHATALRNRHAGRVEFDEPPLPG
jgi:hypothetical protein